MTQNVPVAKQEKRQEIVKDLLGQGMSQREMMEILSKLDPPIVITRRTLTRDIEDVKTDVLAEIKQNSKSIDQILSKLAVNSQKRAKEMWKLYRRSDDGHVKAKALSLTQKEDYEMTKIMQSLGVIREVAPGQREPIKIEFIDPFKKPQKPRENVPED